MTTSRPVRAARRPGREPVAIALAAAAPLAFTAVLVPLRDDVANTSVALLLVLVTAAGAVMGRWAGWTAAVSSAVWFNFFWTEPYQTLVISSRTDVETAVLLLLVGAAVTEIAAWGRREQARASREAGFREGIVAASEAVAAGVSPSALIDDVSARLVPLLGLERCRYDYGTALDHPRLEPDGSVVWRHRTVDVDSAGLPLDKPTELLVEAGGRFHGRFLLTPRPGARPGRAERLVAVALAGQVGAALAAYGADREA
jgi:hypothetical protein